MALSEKKRITNNRYLAKLKSITLRAKPEDVEAMKSAADGAGQSLQGYILQAIAERMEREQAADLKRDGKTE